MKQLFIALFSILSLASCFENKPVESAEHIPIDSICHFYSIELNEMDSTVFISFASWPILDRNKRLAIPSVDKLEINGLILNLENNRYNINILIQSIKNDIITISYFKSDTVFYAKRIKLARFYSCILDFDRNLYHDSIGVYFEPALNMFEELNIEIRCKTDIRKRFAYDESIRNGFTFTRNMITYDDLHKSASIQLEKTFEEKYKEPILIQIETRTTIEKKLEEFRLLESNEYKNLTSFALFGKASLNHPIPPFCLSTNHQLRFDVKLLF